MTPSVRKLGEINILKLINSIKIRPALYNKDDSMYYSHKKFKYKLWREVCQEVYRNWDNLAPHMKLEYARELQKRWKSLRTCFSREVALQKKEKLQKETNVPYKRRKKYEYFNSLIFLLKPNEVKDYTTNNASDSDEDPLDINVSTLDYATMDMEDNESDQEASAHNNPDNLKLKTSSSSQIKLETSSAQSLEYERPLDLDMLKNTGGLDNDEDKMFALSLVSIFKNLNPKKKMEARIEVLKLLQRITYRNDDTDQKYHSNS